MHFVRIFQKSNAIDSIIRNVFCIEKRDSFVTPRIIHPQSSIWLNLNLPTEPLSNYQHITYFFVTDPM